MSPPPQGHAAPPPVASPRPAAPEAPVVVRSFLIAGTLCTLAAGRNAPVPA
jgi:hypothetical protein